MTVTEPALDNLVVNSETSLEQMALVHAESLFSLTEQNRAYLKRWLPWLDMINTLEDMEAFIKLTIFQYADGLGPQFIIRHQGEIAGVIGFHKMDKQNRLASLGFWLGESFTGKGLITQAIPKLLDLGFENYQLNKIEIRCATENTKSREIPERLGFFLEGTLRQQEWLYDHFVSHAVYSMLASEYQADQ